MAVLALGSARDFTYDEGSYVHESQRLINRVGVGAEFLREYPFAAGLSFALLQHALRPVTHLQPRAVRATTLALTGAMILVIGGVLRAWRHPAPLTVAAGVAAIPFVWVYGTMALTEMTGLLPALGGLAILLAAIRRWERGASWAHVAAFAAGVVCGSAFYSRQHLLVVAGAAAAALIGRARRPWRVVIAFWLGAIAAVGPIVWFWGGLQPPFGDFATPEVFSVPLMVRSAGYASVALWLVCPYWYRLQKTWLALLFGAGVLCNYVWPMVEVAPLREVSRHLVSAAWEPAFERASGAVFVGLAATGFGATLRNVWDRRDDRGWLVAVSAMGLVVLSVGFLTQQFSSRYTGVAAPFMVLAAAPYWRPTGFSRALLVFGALLGALDLASYLYL